MGAGAHGPFHWNVPHFVGTYQILARWVQQIPCGDVRREETEETEGGGVEKRTVADGRREMGQGEGDRGEGEEWEEREAGCWLLRGNRSAVILVWYVLRGSTAENVIASEQLYARYPS